MKAYSIFLGEDLPQRLVKFRDLMVTAFLVEFGGLGIAILTHWELNNLVLETKEEYYKAIWLWAVLPISIAIGFAFYRFVYERRNGIPHILYTSYP